MSSCKHPRKTNDYSFGEGYVQFCIECGTKFYWQNEPVTAVAEEKCARCKGSLNWEGTCCYKCTLELTDPQKEEQKGCSADGKTCVDVCIPNMPCIKRFAPKEEQNGCSCKCHKPNWTVVVCNECPCHKSPAETHTVKNFGRGESTYTDKPDSTQDRCTCANNVMYACAFCKKKYEPDSPQEKCEHLHFHRTLKNPNIYCSDCGLVLAPECPFQFYLDWKSIFKPL